MSSGPAAPARLLRRALTIVVGALLVVLAWTSSASADDSPEPADRRSLLGGVADLVGTTTQEVGALLDPSPRSDSAPAREAESPAAPEPAPAERGSDRHAAPQRVEQAATRPVPAADTTSSTSAGEPRPRRALERVTAPIAEVTDPVLEATRPLTEPAAEQVERIVAPVREGLRPVTRELRPVLEPVGAILEPVERTLSPVGDLLEPVTVVLRPVGDLVDDVALPVPLVPSEPSTVIPDEGSGPVRPIPAPIEAPIAEGAQPIAEGVKHDAGRGLGESAATTALVGAPSVSISSVSDVAGTPSPDEDRIPAPAIPAAATGSGTSPAGAGSGGPAAAAALSDVWTPAALLALDRPVGRSTTLLAVAAERPGFAPD